VATGRWANGEARQAASSQSNTEEVNSKLNSSLPNPKSKIPIQFVIC
jgi:hypothetical protein